MTKKPNNQSVSQLNSISDLQELVVNGTPEQLNELFQRVENAERRAAKAKARREKAEKELKAYIRVGCKYYKEVFQPDKTGQGMRAFTEWQKGTIIDDYGKENLELIQQYNGFCCVPSHTNYQAEIGGFFNEYSPLSHQPKKGKFETIQQIINHIFGKEHTDFAYDYLQLLYTKPLQRLPILLLESSEKNTGKSTFGELVKLMFESNAIKLGNSDLDSDFNGFWIKKLALIIDEASLEKRLVMQKLKRLSTETSTVTSNEKGIKQAQIEFYGKFIFCSNEEGKALPIEKGDNRFAVFRVPTFAENGIEEIPNILHLIKQEIPYFLDFLLNRKLVHTETTRSYFSKEVYHTKQLDLYYNNSFSYVAKAIRAFIVDSFNMFDTEQELKFSLTNIQAELKNGNYLKGFDKMQIKKGLEELGIEEHPKGRYTYYSLFVAQSSEQGSIQYLNNRYYNFERGMFDS